jgi:hypothetical protein
VNIEPTLNYLLTHPEPFICLLKGQWGVVKTYFVKKFIREHRDSVVKQSYSYVSLFGISSVESLMQAIYLNSQPSRTTAGLSSDVSSRPTTADALDRVKFLVARAKPTLSRLAEVPLFGAKNLQAFILQTPHISSSEIRSS